MKRTWGFGYGQYLIGTFFTLINCILHSHFNFLHLRKQMICLPQSFIVYYLFIYLYFIFIFFVSFFYCYSITVVCLFSPSLHPTPAEPTSIPHLHPPPWFCPCVLYSSSCYYIFKNSFYNIVNIFLNVYLKYLYLIILEIMSVVFISH